MGIGTLGLIGTVIGAVQLWLYGEVSIRVGYEPTSGENAVQMLCSLAFVSTLFILFGMFQVYRSHRQLGN